PQEAHDQDGVLQVREDVAFSTDPADQQQLDEQPQHADQEHTPVRTGRNAIDFRGHGRGLEARNDSPGFQFVDSMTDLIFAEITAVEKQKPLPDASTVCEVRAGVNARSKCSGERARNLWKNAAIPSYHEERGFRAPYGFPHVVDCVMTARPMT